MDNKEKKDLIFKLHEETALGLYTCKKVLAEFDYDIEKAKEYIKTTPYIEIISGILK